MLVAQARRVFPGRQVVHALVGQPGHVGVQHADIDLLADACRVTMADRRQDADAAVQPGEQVGHRHAHLLRLPVRFAGQTHHPAHALDQAVIARARRIRAGLPEAGDRAIDQLRKLRVQLLIAQAVLGQRPDLEVLHQDVALCDQLQRQFLAFRRRDIQRDRALVAVHPDEIGALLRARHHRRGEAASVVARSRLFDLDHVGTQIAEHLRTGRPRQHAGQVEYAQARKGTSRCAHAKAPDGLPTGYRSAIDAGKPGGAPGGRKGRPGGRAPCSLPNRTIEQIDTAAGRTRSDAWPLTTRLDTSSSPASFTLGN